MRRKANVHGTLRSPETVYAQAKTAGWLLKILEQRIPLEYAFFTCLQWTAGELRPLLQAVLQEAQKLAQNPETTSACEAVKETLSKRHRRLTSEFEELFSEHPCLEGIIRDVVRRACITAQKSCVESMGLYRTALRRLEQTFGLSKDCQALCEFAFINQSFSEVEAYFEDHLEVQKYGNKRILAYMMGVTPTHLQSCLDELFSCGLFRGDRNQFRLRSSLLSLWESRRIITNEIFSRPLSGEILPLEAFHIAQDDVAHVKKLLEQDSDIPVHILLYGPSGTGKSTFAHSMARTCGVKAWAVPSRIGDDEEDRRTSLAACLHIASKHKGAFVLVDEAERLLDTSYRDKSWLNDFLERPRQRVIWTTNEIEDIDPSVRRRFSFSIHFENIGAKARVSIWQKALAKHHISKRISAEQINALANMYPVEAAIIHNAVLQTKALYKEEQNFFMGLERILRSHTILQNDGTKRGKPMAVPDFTLDGVCLDGSAVGLTTKCRRIDAAMRAGTNVRPGCGTMLFYGPPGTGKTALARYIAKELDRECLVKRASDLLSPFLGVAEQQVAAAFRMAEDNGSVLVIDEADTFLFSRDMAQRSWETSLVNEFLTALEECRCFCICTTNRQDNLDAAAMRRFSHKVSFTYAGQEQVQALYTKLLAHICTDPLPRQLARELSSLNRLTPGDFHAVRSQYDPLFVEASEVSHEIIISALAKEQSLKNEQHVCRIGF